MTTTEKKTETKSEIFTLPTGMAGVGRQGDRIVHDPGHPNPRFRLSQVRPIEIGRLEEIKERVRQAEE